MAFHLLFLAVAAGAALAPLHQCTRDPAGDGVYMVIFNPALAPNDAAAWAEKTLGELVIRHTYTQGELLGFSAVLTDDQVLTARQQLEVKWVEENCIFRIPANEVPEAPGARFGGSVNLALPTPPAGTPVAGAGAIPTWNQMSDYQKQSSTVKYSNNSVWNPLTFAYSATTSAALYIIDTGINCNHQEFNNAWGNRCRLGTSTVAGTTSPSDNNGHGTHCAGISGGTWVGVFPNSTLVAVKVLNAAGSGTTDGIVKGLDWAVADAKSRTYAGNVFSMSLGGGNSPTLNAGCTSAINNGMIVIVAAGNDGADAASTSPCNDVNTICIAASTSTNAMASYSNWGRETDLIAPGSSVFSAWYNSNTAYNTISGTSMATPGVAGVAASHCMQKAGMRQSAMMTDLQTKASANAVNIPSTHGPQSTPNLLLYYNIN
jgi:hypothetical protein